MEEADGCGFSKNSEGDKYHTEEEEKGNWLAPTEDANMVASLDAEPATQPCEDVSMNSDDYIESSQEDADPVWGVLYPLREGWRAAKMLQDTCTFGRSMANTFVIGEDQAGTMLKSISKVHFVIRRSRGSIVLIDKSSNGTFVNGKVVGKGRSRHLEHNATIALADPKCKNYVYMSNNKDFQRDYPRELTSKYVVSKDLGAGACGVVKLGFRISSDQEKPQRLAIKIIDKRKVPISKGVAGNVLNEVNILRAVDHPCIIRLEDVVDTDRFLCIVLELADGGELFEKIIEKTKFNEHEAKVHFYQMVSAIQYLHSKNVCHRDLKPENILLCSDDETKPLIKITDMGLSKLVDMDSKLKTFCGTPQYLAPEVLMSRVRGDGSYGFEVDMWSLGVVLYVLLCGCPPFSPDRADKPLVRQVCDGDYSFPPSRWANICREAVDLIKKLMTVERRKRLTAQQALLHPWLDDPVVKKKVNELMEMSRGMRNPEGSSVQMGPPRPLVREPSKNCIKKQVDVCNTNMLTTASPPNKRICADQSS